MSRKTKDRLKFLKKAIEATADGEGRITPDGIVAAAKNPKNPLHGEFDWNDATAAHQHRLAVARHLIRTIEYVGTDVKGRPVTAIAYVHEPSAKEQSYVPLTKAQKDKALARSILTDELARCEAAIRRAREIADVLRLRDELDDLLRGIIDLRKRAA